MYYQPKIEFSPDEVLDYLRKSRSDDPLLEVEEVLAKHEAILDEWAAKFLGAPVPEANKFREVVSGETIDGRPEFQKLLKKIESPKYKAILVVEVQRLSRGDLEDAGRLIKVLRYTDTVVITPQKTYDLRDEYDRDIFERELKRGNEYLEYQKKIMGRGKLLEVSQGWYIGSKPPYGYDKTYVVEGKKKHSSLIENKEEADVVRLIFDLYVNKDMGSNNIAHHLDGLGVKPRNGKHWGDSVIRSIIGNEHYTGKVFWQQRKTTNSIEDGEVKTSRPRAKAGEYLLYDGKHEALIDEELFQKAREKKDRAPRVKITNKVRNPFAGLIVCSCGRMVLMKNNPKIGTDEPDYTRLACADQVHCGSGSCRYSEMLDRVTDILEQSVEDFELRIKSDEGETVKLHEKLIANTEKKLKDLEAKELAMWEAQSHPDEEQRMPAAIFKQLNQKLLHDKDDIRKSLEELYSSRPKPIDYAERLGTLREALAALRDPDVSAEAKNKLLKLCIDKIVYSREGTKRMKPAPGESLGLKKGGWLLSPVVLDVHLRL